MTTVVAKRTKDGVRFAFDSQVTWGSAVLNTPSKVFRNGPVVFGVAGSMRDRDILEHVLEVPKFKTGTDPERWIVRKLVPAIQDALDKSHQLEVKNQQAWTDSHVIVSIPGCLGVLSGALSLVGMSEQFVGVGSGADFALGALHAGANLTKAVEIASLLDIGTGGAIQTMEVMW